MKRNKYLYNNLAYNVYKLEKVCEECWQDKWKICIHHIDENPCNNEKDNLKILCHSCHIILHKTWKKHTKEARKKISMAQYKKIKQYSLEWDFIKTWDSIKEAQKTLKLWNISSVCKWRIKQDWNFIWEYN